MIGMKNQVFENTEVILTLFGNKTLTQKMLKMKIGLDESLKTKGQIKCSGWFDENK
ncbi:MAG: hypothetical protein ABSG32_19395 [Terriglobia bacterium]|jgi:hypothetical protein